VLQNKPMAIRVGQVTAVAWPPQVGLATELAQRAAQPAEWPGLGRRHVGALRLILVPDRRRLDSLSSGRAPEWGAAVALPDARTILLRADAPELYRTLRHELAHLILHQAIVVRVPLWFDEGYAAWAAGEWERLGALELNLAVVRGAVPDLPGLDGTLRGSASTADASYALAVSAVTELARRNPSNSIAPLLQRLRQGQDFEAALKATTGLTLSQFDIEWRRSLRRRYSLAIWLVAGGGWGVLTLGLWALLRRRRALDLPRRAALDHGWEIPPEESAASELDPTREP
jgi:Peptidase MA superfamily